MVIRLISLISLSLILLVNSAFAESYVEGEVIVKYKDGFAATRSLAINSRSVMAARTMPEYVDENAFLVRTTDNVTNSIDILMQDPNVLYAQPNFIKYARIIPNDPAFTSTETPSRNYQFKAENGINAEKAWDKIKEANRVIVAVIDTGIKRAHEDLAANVLINDGYDAFGNNGGEDTNGHGTHVAGIIGAVGDNNKGTSGIAWKVKMLPIRVLNDKGEGSTKTTVPSFNHAINKNARVVNMSLGSDYNPKGEFDRTEYDALKKAIDNGVVIIAAAGNDSRDTDREPEFPAAYGLRGLISVGASNNASSLTGFGDGSTSCYGQTTVHLFAPGDRIYSTYNTSDSTYGYLSGTSMATPVITGAVALMLEKDTTLKPWQVEQILINSTRASAPLKELSMSGGILDLDKALSFDKRLLFEAPEILDISLVAGTGRTVEISWSAHAGQTEIWARTDTNSKFIFIDRVASGVTEYTDRVSGTTNGNRYYRIRGLKNATYTPFVKKSVRNPNNQSQTNLDSEFVVISDKKNNETAFNGYLPVEPDMSDYVGTEEPQPVIKGSLMLSTTNLVFNDTAVGKTSQLETINITNLKKNSVTITITSPEAPFILENSSTCKDILNIDNTCSIDIKFQPTKVGNVSQSITVNASDSTEKPITISLSGTGVKAKAVPVSGGCSVGYGADYFMIIILLSLLLRRRFLVKK